MHRYALGIALIAGFSPFALGTSWKSIDPEEYAEQCPIIVRGTIVTVEKAKPSQDRIEAVVRIEAIVKNELKDVPLKVGDDFATRRNVGNRPSGSEDMDYPVKTQALWLVVLDEEGDFRISDHPSQKQHPKLVLNLGLTDDRYPRAAMTKKQWIELERKRNARQTPTPEQRKADERALREVSRTLADAPKIDADSMRRFAGLTVERRLDFLRYADFEQPLNGERQGEVIAYLLAHDTDEGTRAAAATCLAGRDLPRDGFVGKALTEALADRSPRVRHSACIALQTHKEQRRTAAIAALLKDEDRSVRLMVVRVLGRFREVRAIPAILALYEREKADELREFTFAESLAHLGEKKVSLVAAKRAMESDNVSVRHSVVDSLREIDAKARGELDHLVAAELGEPFPKSPFAIDLARFSPWATRLVGKPFEQSTDDVRAAIRLVGLLKLESEREHLTDLASDRDRRVRTAVAAAVGRLGGEKAVPVLRKLMRSTGAGAAWELIRLGPVATPVIAEVIREGTGEEDLSYEWLIRAYVDHWKEVPKPLDAKIVDAVRASLAVPAVRAHRTEYHEQFLKLVAEPRKKE